MNIGVLISGRGTNLEAIIKAVKEGKIKASIPVVVSNKKDARGLKIAEKYGIRGVFLNPDEFSSREDFDSAVANLLEKNNVDLVILAGYMRILSDYFIDKFEGRLLNIHPSLIPAFQGLKPQKRAVEYGVMFSGCTVHFVTRELDNGPVIIQAVVPVLPDDTEESLSERILKYEHRIYPQAVKWYVDGRIKLNGRKVFVEKAVYGTVPVNPELEDF